MTIEKKMKLEITHSFPPEIIREILLKATVKSLLRCKCVCKEWYSLISDQNFIKTHCTLSSTNDINCAHHRLIYNTHEQENNLYSCSLYDVLFDKPAINVLLFKYPLQRTQALLIVGSCNRLVLLYVEDDDGYELFIYNPSTRIWNGLPYHRGFFCERYCYSFGYDESTHDYKIVEMFTTIEVNRVNIYSLKTRKWKIIGDFSYEYPFDGCGIFSNGALHWVAYSDSPRTERIVSIDLAKDPFAGCGIWYKVLC
ncbi:F-box associated domain containing protein [Tanacetum coccineum]